MQANLRTARARDSAQQRVYAHEPSGDGDGGRSSATAAAVASGQIEQAGAPSAAAAEAGLLELHEEYVRSRTILELAQFRPVVVDAVFGDKAGAGRQKQALKAAITDRDRLVLDLCHKVETLRGLEAQVRTRSEERCRLMLRTRTLADAKMQLEAERRRRNDSAEDRAGVAATRAAITLQIKRSIILRNVMASLVSLEMPCHDILVHGRLGVNPPLRERERGSERQRERADGRARGGGGEGARLATACSTACEANTEVACVHFCRFSRAAWTGHRIPSSRSL